MIVIKKKIKYILAIFLLFASLANAVTVDETTFFTTPNVTFGFPGTQEYTIAQTGPTWLRLNDTYFNFTAPCATNVTIYQIVNASTVNITFNATATGTFYLNMSGFLPNTNYSIYYNNTLNTTEISNVTGHINLTYSYTNGDHNVLIQQGESKNLTRLCVTYTNQMTDVTGIGNSVFNIVGVIFIISAILLVFIITKKYYY